MKTRGMRFALVAAALLLAVAAMLVGLLRSGPPPHVTETRVTGVRDRASGHDAEQTPRPDLIPPAATPVAGGRAAAQASQLATEESPDRYPTGTARATAEAPMGAPTSSGPELPYDEAPDASSYDSPTGSQPEAGAPQLPADEPYDRAPTAMPSDAPALPAADVAVDGQQSSPTEAPPY